MAMIAIVLSPIQDITHYALGYNIYDLLTYLP